MACSGGHCTLHNNAGTIASLNACGAHRPVCSTNNALYTLSSGVSTGLQIKASDVEALRTRIRSEIDKFRAHAYYSTAVLPSFIAADTKITTSQTRQMPDAIDDLSPRIDSYVYQAANTVSSADNSPRSADDPSGGGNAYVRNWGNAKSGSIIRTSHIQLIYNMYQTIRQDCICNSDCDCNAVCNCHNNCGCHY